MSRESYDVDDILKEVRKRREENEARIKGEAAEEAEQSEKKHDETAEADGADNEALEQDEPSAEDIIEETADDIAHFGSRNTEYESNPSEEEKSESLSKSADISGEGAQAEEPALQEPLAVDRTESEDAVRLVDLYNETEDAYVSKRKNKKKKSKTSKILKAIIFILVIAIIATGTGAYIYINKSLNNVTDNPEQSESLDEWKGMDVLKEDFSPIYEDPKSEISSYKDMLKTWYYNGNPVSSTHVLNVLFIGEDTRDEEIIDEGTRADSAIIVSVNKDTGEITLTSILRDSYCYYEVTSGDKSSGKYGKINGAMMDGGIDCYIRAVENNFKINIDNYVIVNFDSFEKIIDSIGGVTVDITQAEINEINNHQNRYGNVTINADPGPVLLDGSQALAYCRIRYIDSDGVRADRQKAVLLQIFEKMKDASTVKILEVANTLLPYVKTGYSKSEVVSIARYALKSGWLGFSTQTCTVPANETDENGAVITTCKGGTFYGVWCWKVDFPLSAQLLQKKIYGKTNIVLAENRANFLNLS